jgi:hypothetical protein
VTARYAVLALLALLLIVFPALALVTRIVGTRLLGRQARAVIPTGEELSTLAELQLAGFATDAQLAALTARERHFLAQAASPRIAMAGTEPGTHAPRAAAPHAPSDREVPVTPFHLVCPACGASLGAAADVAHYVGSCPSCSRRVASRRRGARISLTAIDAVRPRK